MPTKPAETTNIHELGIISLKKEILILESNIESSLNQENYNHYMVREGKIPPEQKLDQYHKRVTWYDTISALKETIIFLDLQKQKIVFENEKPISD